LTPVAVIVQAVADLRCWIAGQRATGRAVAIGGADQLPGALAGPYAHGAVQEQVSIILVDAAVAVVIESVAALGARRFLRNADHCTGVAHPLPISTGPQSLGHTGLEFYWKFLIDGTVAIIVHIIADLVGGLGHRHTVQSTILT
jgi:hypothetical protein